ncbi:hypothetical protein DFH07DRAFT_818030 [Mycena maculata]|uniref:Uncharacterized protein n=1 Tax=Mycena maculata TaxID=230809 RepID=A0AAD7NEL4_9AGAR|nr:hypothetical protein DFH07DRAFT_818030 [Mycena maculata]
MKGMHLLTASSRDRARQFHCEGPSVRRRGSPLAPSISIFAYLCVLHAGAVLPQTSCRGYSSRAVHDAPRATAPRLAEHGCDSCLTPLWAQTSRGSRFFTFFLSHHLLSSPSLRLNNITPHTISFFGGYVTYFANGASPCASSGYLNWTRSHYRC